MATKNKTTIIADVRLILDEQRTNTVLVSEGDMISEETDTILWGYITQAVDEVHVQAQPYLLTDIVQRVTVNVSQDGTRKGKKGSLPADFLRIMRVDAADWKKPVHECIDADSDEYLQQQSRWAGVRGNAERPVVAITASNTAALDLEVYETTESSVTVDYVQRAQVNSTSGDVTIAAHCYRALLYVLAKHYLLTLGDYDKANVFGATAGGLLGIVQQPITETSS